MDWNTFWGLMGAFSDLFYDPVVFWGVPFGLAVVWSLLRSR